MLVPHTELDRQHASAEEGLDQAAERIELLTGRERQVLSLVAVGMSNNRISDLLIITERTVKAHLSRIMAKLRVESRLQAGLAGQLLRDRPLVPTQEEGRSSASSPTAANV